MSVDSADEEIDDGVGELSRFRRPELAKIGVEQAGGVEIGSRSCLGLRPRFFGVFGNGVDAKGDDGLSISNMEESSSELSTCGNSEIGIYDDIVLSNFWGSSGVGVNLGSTKTSGNIFVNLSEIDMERPRFFGIFWINLPLVGFGVVEGIT